MLNKKTMFWLFIALALVMTGYLLFASKLLQSSEADAGSFGISPPFVNGGDMLPGETHTQRITLMRGEAETSSLIDVAVEAREFEPWISVQPEILVFSKGQKRTSVNVALAVPPDAYAGAYKGSLLLGLGPKNQKARVGISLGAQVQVSFNVMGDNLRPEEIEIYNTADNDLYRRTAGKILIIVDDLGKAYFIDRSERKAVSLSNYPSLKSYLKESARGISKKDLWKIPVALTDGGGKDTDGDGLTDVFEEALGTNIYFADSDDDGFDDRSEIENGFIPVINTGTEKVDKDFSFKQSGYFFTAVENRGEIWFVSSRDNKRYLIAGEADIFKVIRKTGVGASKSDFSKLISSD